jgi:hypothetical protein
MTLPDDTHATGGWQSGVITGARRQPYRRGVGIRSRRRKSCLLKIKIEILGAHGVRPPTTDHLSPAGLLNRLDQYSERWAQRCSITACGLLPPLI